MNKPGAGNDSESTVFLVVLVIIGVVLPVFVCAGGLLFFGMAAPVRAVGPAPTVTTFGAPTTGTYRQAPGVDAPTTLPPAFRPDVSSPTTMFR